jgi:hypothetical protein
VLVEARAWPAAAGAGTPPWQLDGALAALGRGTPPPGMAVFLGRGVPPDRARRGYGWEPGLASAAAELTPLDRVSWRHLAEVAPIAGHDPDGAVPVPAALVGRPAVLLRAARTDAWTGVGGAVCSGWYDLIRRPTRFDRARLPAVLASALARRRRLHGDLLAVIDAAVVGLGPAPSDLRPTAAHVLLAGTDPVAVDAVLARWLGLDPRQLPHLRACAERGLGTADPGQIRLIGEPAWLEGPPGVGPGGPALPTRVLEGSVWSRLGRRLRAGRFSAVGTAVETTAAGLSLRRLRRRRRWRRFLETGWGRLWAASVAGKTGPGEEDR